jgi:lactoylglutathione lyase
MARIAHLAVKVTDSAAPSEFLERVFGFRVFAECWERDHLVKHLTDGALDLAIVRFDHDVGSPDVTY